MLRRFDRKFVKEVQAVINAAVSKNPTIKAMGLAEVLSQAGISHANKGAWTNKEVSNFLRDHYHTRRRVRFKKREIVERTPETKSSQSDIMDVAEIVMCSNMTKEQKLKILAPVFGA